jgi:hypothetical protein
MLGDTTAQRAPQNPNRSKAAENKAKKVQKLKVGLQEKEVAQE